MRITAIDVAYREDLELAIVGVVAWKSWKSIRASHRAAYPFRGPIHPYTKGRFHQRELPYLLRGLTASGVLPHTDLIVIDGHCWVGQDGEMGLGAYLWESLAREWPVVGVAKNPLESAPSIPCYRGRSTKPLWISSCGIGLDVARKGVSKMGGGHRIPTNLKRADGITKSFFWEEIHPYLPSEEEVGCPTKSFTPRDPPSWDPVIGPESRLSRHLDGVTAMGSTAT